MYIPRWNECVDHYGTEAETFFSQHFSEKNRNVLFIAGAGFDPRATLIVEKLHPLLHERLHCVFIREDRPDPDPQLVERATANLDRIQKFCANVEVLRVQVFADDNAVVGGIDLIKSLAKISYDKYSDVIVDMSALSVGISFPAVRLLFQVVQSGCPEMNIHVVVISNPQLDSLIRSAPNDRATEVRGFPRERLLSEAEKAILWLPQLATRRKAVLDIIYKEVRPHDVCPILPFSSTAPKKGDEVVGNFIPELQEWSVDPRNFVYADENSPLDIYRSILQICEQRAPVFETFGGSAVIISPLGSKLLAIGALMAALEKQLPIVYVEALAYKVNWDAVDEITESESRIAHIWLHGEAYLRDQQGYTK